MISFQKYVGKTYKLPTSLTQGSQLDPEFIQKNILNSLNILDQKPLFSVLSKQENSYTLGLNLMTLKSLGWAPYKRWADIIRYVKNQNGWVITIVDKKNPKNNSITLSNDGGKRSLDLKAVTNSLKNGKFSMKFHLSEEAIYLNLTDKYFSCILDWKDNRFNLGIVNKSKYDTTIPTFSIKVFGDLFMDGSKMDLTIVSNGRSIGSLVGKKQGNTWEYSLRLNIAMPFVTFLTNISGNYINEIGDYTILVPSIYELLDNTINE